MAGSREQGLEAAKTNKRKYGPDFYRRIGARGGSARVPKGFASNLKLASSAGSKGGRSSKRQKDV